MKKNILACLFLVAVFALMAAPLAAQAVGVPAYDPVTVDLILAGALGVTVVGLTEMLKRWLKTTGLGSYLVSLAVSAGATAYYLVRTDGFNLLAFLGYTAFVFLSANGIFKAVKGTT